MYTCFSDVRLAGVALLRQRANGDTGKRIEGVKRGVQALGELVRRCCFVAVFGGISACATFEVGPFLKEQITGDTWRACLAREYQRQAKIHVRTDRNWGEATRLAERGQAALDGRDIAATYGKKTCACATAQARQDAAAPGIAEAVEACEKS
jgi:hypothetical protein